jgi:hypothetical protein
VGVETGTLFGGEIRVGDVAKDFFAVALGEGHVDDGHLPAEFDVSHDEGGGTDICTPEEFEM